MSKEKTTDSDPAFAAASQYRYVSGLTKREYFAAMALQGSVSAQSMSHPDWIQEKLAESHAEKAVMLADALIEALNKEKP